MKRAAAVIIWTVAPFYAYGVVDIVIVTGLFLGWKIGFAAFYLAALSQIVLYTLLRDWITDVPPEFAVIDEERGYVTTLVIFHCVTFVLVSVALRLRSKAN